MDWYYYDGKDRFGPLGDEQFVEAIRDGKLTDSMLVWKPGMAGWEKLTAVRNMPEFAALPGIKILTESFAAAHSVPCMGCGKFFPRNEVLTFEKGFICPHCKPEFFQRLKEGAPLPVAHISTMDFSREIMHHDYDLKIFDCVRRGFRLYLANFWLTVGVAFISYVLLMVSGSLPCGLGAIASLILAGPVVGGRFNFFVNLSRGKNIGLSEMFDGFKGDHFLQLMLGNIIKFLFYLAVAIPFAVVFIVLIVVSTLNPEKLFVGASAVVFLSLVGLCVPAFVYLAISWIFTFPLIIDKGLPFWHAMKISFKMVNKHWFKVFGLVFISGILACLGVIFLCIGVFFSLPILYGSLAYAYADIFKG